MAKSATHLKKFTNRVAQIRKAHPNMAYKTAQKQASRELKSGKKIGGTTTRKKAAPRKKTRKKAAAPRVIKRTDVYETIGSMKSKVCKQLEAKYGDLAIKRRNATRKTDKRRYTKEMSVVNSELNKFKPKKKAGRKR